MVVCGSAGLPFKVLLGALSEHEPDVGEIMKEVGFENLYLDSTILYWIGMLYRNDSYLMWNAMDIGDTCLRGLRSV